MTKATFILWIMWETITIAIKAASVSLVAAMFIFTVFALLHSLWSDKNESI